jgi:hypothetical protein
MREVNTVFASIDNYEKGGVEITGKDTAEHYLFSNMFEVAENSAPWERVVVATNLEYVMECVRAEGESPWYVAAHDENVLVMQGGIDTHFIKPEDAATVPPEDKNGAVKLVGEPAGKNMGWVKASQGHMTLLPAGAAYQMRARELSVLLIQTIKGDESVEKWAEICQRSVA